MILWWKDPQIAQQSSSNLLTTRMKSYWVLYLQLFSPFFLKAAQIVFFDSRRQTRQYLIKSYITGEVKTRKQEKKMRTVIPVKRPDSYISLGSKRDTAPTLVTLPLATFGGLFKTDIRFLRGVSGDLATTLDWNNLDGVVAVELAVEFVWRRKLRNYKT